jgi:putative acetyltransferase
MNVSEPAIEIRRATRGDASAIAAVLHTAFVEYEHRYTQEAFAAPTPSAELLSERMEEGPVWVALQEEQIVGTVSAVPEEQACYLRSMAILPAARGQRIGTRLLEQVEQCAREQGVDCLYLRTTPFLERAIRLYEHCGFRRSEEGPLTLFGTPLFTMMKSLPVGGEQTTISSPRSS